MYPMSQVVCDSLSVDGSSSFFNVTGMDIREQFGKNVRALRLETGKSQEDFAFDAGIHRTYVSGVERGTRNPSLLLIERFAAALGVTPGDLLDYHLTVEVGLFSTDDDDLQD